MPNLLEQSGAQPQKQPKFAPLFIDKAFTGIYTQRSVLHDPSDLATSRFYGGRPDALWQGSNVELTNRLTLQRRPGLSEFSTVTYPTPPDRGFSFQLLDGTIRVIIDTESTGALSVTSVATSVGGNAVYTGTFPGGVGNTYVGMKFTVSGFVGAGSDSIYTAVASTGTTITLNNPHATAETAAASMVSSGAVYWDQQNGSKTLIFAKGTGAGQTYFVAVAGILYMGDGVETFIYTPLNPNAIAYGFGLVAPVNGPTITTTESAASAVAWQAHTYFTTMGLIVDSNGNIEQLSGVNADGTNPTLRFGTSSNGQPPWNQATGGTTADGSVTWTNQGPIGTWAPKTTYQPGQAIYDPGTKCVFIQTHNFAATSGPSAPQWNPALVSTGARTSELNAGGATAARWGSLGQLNVTPTLLRSWTAGETYGTYVEPSTGNDPNVLNCATIEPTLILPPLAGQNVYLQGATTGGVTGTGATPPPWQTAIGQTTTDGQLTWTMLGSATWTALTSYTAWVSGANTFSVIEDTNGNLQVCMASGISGPTIPAAWGTTYGATTLDGSGTSQITWVCVGAAIAWAANTIWYLPLAGFVPPSKNQPYGSASVIDTQGDLEYVISSGESGSVTPAWQAIGFNTTDNTITWYNSGVAQTNSLAWTQGYSYAYSYYSRTTTDFYDTNPPPGLNLIYPAGLGQPTGSETGAISTASPATVIGGPNTGAINTVSGISSLDPAVDTIIIWRSADGGGSDNMFFLTEIPNPLPNGGQPVVWHFQDYLPDVAIGVFQGLNNLIPAPIDDENDPPPNNFLPMTYNFQRIWGASGSSVVFSGGPDVITGNANFAFNPSDTFPYLADVIRIVKTSTGQVVFLTDSIEFLAGGPLTASFYSVTLGPGIGLRSFNALDVYAGEIYFVSSDGQFRVINPSLNISNAGFPIGDQLAVLNTSKIYVAVQQAGVDNAIYVADGSTGWWRCNPHQVPGSANGPEPIWSPFANITNGCQMVQSIEITPGIKKLLVGGVGDNENILFRDLTVYTDGVVVLNPSPINLLTTSTYGVLAGSTITNSGTTTINGDLGLSPGSAVTGAPVVTGATNIDNPAAVQAQTDLVTAYNQAAAFPGAVTIPTELGGTTLPPGVYSSLSGTFSITTGTLTLDAAGNPNAFWIFKTATTLVLGTGTSVSLINKAQSLNVFWQVGSSATIGVGAVFQGTILALTSISVNTGAILTGRLLAQTGAVTLLGNTITTPSSTVTGQYDAYFVMGSIMLAHPGQIAVLGFIEGDFSGVAYQPQVGFLLNEIAGSFVNMPLKPQFDPPTIYGDTIAPTSYSPNRYYFAATGTLARCRHLQIKVDFGITPNGDELYNLTIFGRVFVEN